jgi:ABC-type iron transport system FetAB ATPase subunit
MAVLGELPLLKGDLKVRGKIGYASQKPWIFSGTVKQNILFGQTLIESRYKRVIRACALEKVSCYVLKEDLSQKKLPELFNSGLLSRAAIFNPRRI